MSSRRRLLAASCLLAAWATSARADGTEGRLSGSVSGPDGSRLPGVTLVLRRHDSGSEVRLATGELGLFRSPALAPGLWDVTAELSGFVTLVERGVQVAAGGDRSLALRLEGVAAADSVTVTETVPRDSLEAPRIRESGARDAGEALASVAGVTALRKGGIANEVVVRGLQSRDLNVLVDGQRVYGACPNHMDPAIFHVDFAQIERIEVGKGPFDLQSQGSLGGVVNVVTRVPEGGWHVTPQVSAGSFGFVNPSVTLSRGGERLSALAGYSWRQSGVYEDGSGEPFTAHANYLPGAPEERAFAIGTAWGRVVATPSGRHRIDVSYSAQRGDTVLYPYLFMDAGWDDMDRVNVRYDLGRAGDAVRLSAQGYWTRVDHWMDDRLRASSVGSARGYSMGTMALTRTAGGRVQGVFGTTTAGIEGYVRTWDATNEMAGTGYRPQAMIPDVAVKVLGAFVEHSREVGPQLRLDLGGRIDGAWSEADERKANTDLYAAYHRTRSTSARDTLPSAKARLTWRRGGLEIAAGLGHLGRVPEPNERYLALRRKGSDWVGDPSVAPSRNTGLDVAAAWEGGGARVGASLFHQWIADFIAVVPAARVELVPGVPNTEARSFANVDARIAGAELTAGLALGGHFFLAGDLAYARGTQEGDPGRGVAAGPLAEMPPLLGHASIRYDDGRAFVALEGVFSSKQDRIDAALQERATPAWAVANARAGFRWRMLHGTVGVSNLFDTDYVEHLSFIRDPFRTGARVHSPGRNLYVNVSARF
jgi:iron complex outermembrane receptor protein